MFRYVWIVPMCVLIVSAQPLTCKEDTHCSEGYYCESRANLCVECLRCHDVKRIEATPPINICIKSIDSCGPCIEGFVNIHKDGVKGKCVTPEFLEVGSKSWDFAYIWGAAMCVAVLIVITFSCLIRHTDVFIVVAHYNPVSSESTTSEFNEKVSQSVAVSPRRLLNFLTNFDNKAQITTK